jgi:tetratricopeptide (TPR) repeat protein
VPFAFRVANALVSYVTYLVKMVWPSGLAVLYPYRMALSPLHWIGAGLILTGISAWVIRGWRRDPYLAVGWFWYLGSLLPVIGLVQVGNQSMADRYTYVPLIGIFLMLVWYAADAAAHFRRGRAWLAGLAGLVIVACMVATWLQVGHWRNSVTLYERALAVTKGNAVAHNNLGYVLETAGKLDEALLHYREALRISPTYGLANSNLGNVLMAKGHTDQAIRHYEEALRLNPDFVLAHNWLGLALDAKGRHGEAVAHYREALRLEPGFAPARSNLGVALMRQGNLDEALEHCRQAVRLNPVNAQSQNNLAVVLERHGNRVEAVAHYREALRLDPQYVRAHSNLGLLLARQGNGNEAIPHFREVLRVDSESPEAHKGLAMALADQGKHQEAVEHYREAIRLRPDDPSPYNNLAWIRATHPDPGLRNGEEAVQLAQRACDLWGKKDPNLLDTLAAAYAEAGRFPEAIQTLEQAISLVEPDGPEGGVTVLESRLRAYRAGSPHRETQRGDHVQR